MKDSKEEVEVLEERNSNSEQEGLVEEKTEKEGIVNEDTSQKRKGKNGSKIIIALLFFIVIVGGLFAFFLLKDKFIKPEKTENDVKEYKSEYRLSGNSLEDFDLYFLQLENNAKNKVYSPLSIKYALAMLSEGASGDTKAQIDSVIGDYKAKKYTNNANMSFANAMFIRNSFKKSVKENYTSNLSNKFGAEIIYDSFENASNMNLWVKNKTLNLIDNLFNDEQVSGLNYILTNALAIDMKWNKTFQVAVGEGVDNSTDPYYVKYAHEKFHECIGEVASNGEGYSSLAFNKNSMNAKAVEIGAAINKYDIVNELGEKNIRKTVGAEYEKWLATEAKDAMSVERDVNKYLDGYIKEINSNYKRLDVSTDFTFYVDDNVKVIAKDLKEYDGTTLQYVGIMPKTDTLDNYIKNIKAEDINKLISSLKEVKLENFKDGVVTKITGYIPLFKFDYKLDLINDLQKLGITDVFDINKADLSKISSSEKTYIGDASHKANIEFSNEGIKAAAVTHMGGDGAVGSFDYLYDVPTEIIDLTFDNPYLFLIRDKNTGEVWFSGSVYEPIVYQKPVYNY